MQKQLNEEWEFMKHDVSRQMDNKQGCAVGEGGAPCGPRVTLEMERQNDILTDLQFSISLCQFKPLTIARHNNDVQCVDPCSENQWVYDDLWSPSGTGDTRKSPVTRTESLLPHSCFLVSVSFSVRRLVRREQFTSSSSLGNEQIFPLSDSVQVIHPNESSFQMNRSGRHSQGYKRHRPYMSLSFVKFQNALWLGAESEGIRGRRWCSLGLFRVPAFFYRDLMNTTSPPPPLHQPPTSSPAHPRCP